MFFASRDRWIPLACGNDTGYEQPGECRMTEISDPSILAISEVVVEMDTARVGEFRACNLVQNPAINFPRPTNYSCARETHHSSGHHPAPPPAACSSFGTEHACGEYHGSAERCRWVGGACRSFGCANLSAAQCACAKEGAQYDPACEPSSSHGGGGSSRSLRCVLDSVTHACAADNTTLGTETVKDFFGPGRTPGSSGSSHHGSQPRKVAPWDWWKCASTVALLQS